MKKRKEKLTKKRAALRRATRPAFAAVFSAIAFFACSFAVLNSANESERSPEIAAEQKQTDVPYRKLPENKNICLCFEGGDACILQLDFENGQILAVYIDEYRGKKETYFGYKIDYTVHLSNDTVGQIIDRLGGLNLQTLEGEMRCTGVQVQQMMREVEDEKEFKKTVILKIFEQICKNGFTKEDLLYIIEEDISDLSLVDTFYWHSYLPDMAARINFVN